LTGSEIGSTGLTLVPQRLMYMTLQPVSSDHCTPIHMEPFTMLQWILSMGMDLSPLSKKLKGDLVMPYLTNLRNMVQWEMPLSIPIPSPLIYKM